MNARHTAIKPIAGLLLTILPIILCAGSLVEAAYQSPTPTATGGPPQLFPDALCGPVGQIVTVDGDNFRANQVVAITWDGFALATTPATAQADPAGQLRFSFAAPSDFAGPHQVRVDDGQRAAQFTFTLDAVCATPVPTGTPVPTATPLPTETPTPTASVPQPRLTCDPAAALPDQTIYVHGEEFHPGGPFYQLRWDGVVIPWAPAGLTVGDDGRFDLWFNAPADTFELHTLVADDGQGGQATCFVDLMPRDPTPTWTPTPTPTPTPTATWTPGPPPRITVTPTLTPSPTDYCAAIDAVFRPDPTLTGGPIEAGIALTNLNRAWGGNELALGIWQYDQLAESDTGERLSLPALAGGETLTLRHHFPAPPLAGPVWFQLRLIESASGAISNCTSPWFPLQVIDDAPHPPPLLTPADNVWLDARQTQLAWRAASLPPGAGPVNQYQVQLLDVDSGELLLESAGPTLTAWPHELDTDYGEQQLAWRVRARNAGGWGRWATAFYFGVDTTRPQVEIELAGERGDNGWWRAPLLVRIEGRDPAPGAGLVATYLQAGDVRWEQVIPGAANQVAREGEYSLRAYGRDGALNRSPVRVAPVKVDLDPPWRLAAHYMTNPAASGWYTAPLTIAFSAEDAVSGVAETRGQVDGGAWQADQVEVTAEGIHTVEYLARDMAGHETELRKTTAKLDLSPPTAGLALNGTLCQTCPPATASLSAGDSQSGLAHWTLALASIQASRATGLAAPLPQGELILASGSDASRDVPLDGRELPPGPLLLRLAVQDRAGWLSTQTLTATNAAAEAGPTPTPWLMPTATLWPSPTPGAPAYATITPTPAAPVSDTGGDDDDDDGDSGDDNASDDPPGYPVAGTVVPALLPVTGGSQEMESVIIVGLALISILGWLGLVNHQPADDD